MRLLVIGPGHPFRGGIARTTTELVRALRLRGHAVSFFVPRRQYPAWLYPGGDDRDADACPALEGSLAVVDPLRPWYWPRIRRAALAASAEVWLLPYWTWAWAGLWWFLLAQGQRPPAVAVVHNPVDHDARTLHRLAAFRVLERCQGLFTHAQVLARSLSQRHPGRPVAAHPIPPPSAFDLPDRGAARDRLAVPVGPRLALFLGLIRPYKGVDLLIEACSRLPAASDWLVMVAGEPWRGLGRQLQRRVDELGVGDRVRLVLRWIPEAEVPTLLAACDVVVLPYRSGSQSAVAPLALGAGVPVVATGVGGLPEVVRHGVNGMIAEAGSVESLVAVFEQLDRVRLDALAAGAREWARAVTWSTYAEALEGLLERVISTGSPAHSPT